VVPPAANGTRDIFEAMETNEGLVVALRSAVTMVERPKSARQARKLLLIRTFAYSNRFEWLCVG